MARFYSPMTQYEPEIKAMTDRLFCIDREQVSAKAIFGDWFGSEYGYIEVNLLPCQAGLAPEEVPVTC